jgi:hypothetical protein
MVLSYISVCIACFSCVHPMHLASAHSILEVLEPPVRFDELFSPETFGCTYPEACNYDENAEVDDGSCDFSCVLSDYCGEGTEWNSSLLMCLPISCSCLGDLNGNQLRDIHDLIGLLTVLGLDCIDL